MFWSAITLPLGVMAMDDSKLQTPRFEAARETIPHPYDAPYHRTAVKLELGGGATVLAFEDQCRFSG